VQSEYPAATSIEAGFILKDATFEDFIATIRSVADRAQVLPPRMTGTWTSWLFTRVSR